MNLGNLGKVENYTTILDQAFNNASKIASVATQKKYSSRLTKMKETNKIRIETASKSIASYLDNVSSKFPYLEDLHPFYQEYIRLSINEDEYRKSLATLRWGMRKATEFSSVTIRKIARSQDEAEILKFRKEFYGRVSSIAKQMQKSLNFLDEARKEFRKFPNIKTKYPNIVVAGFPNVGKSTLMKNLTGANPEINNFAFTTKTINIGYYEDGNVKLQFLDVPGVFDRKKEEMNNIELKAYAAVSHLPSLIVVVIDISLSSGYDLDEQLNLLKNFIAIDKPVIIALNKVDLISASEVKTNKTKIKSYIKADKNTKIVEISADKKTGLDELVKMIIENLPDEKIEEERKEEGKRKKDKIHKDELEMDIVGEKRIVRQKKVKSMN